MKRPSGRVDILAPTVFRSPQQLFGPHAPEATAPPRAREPRSPELPPDVSDGRSTALRRRARPHDVGRPRAPVSPPPAPPPARGADEEGFAELQRRAGSSPRRRFVDVVVDAPHESATPQVVVATRTWHATPRARVEEAVAAHRHGDVHLQPPRARARTVPRETQNIRARKAEPSRPATGRRGAFRDSNSMAMATATARRRSSTSATPATTHGSAPSLLWRRCEPALQAVLLAAQRRRRHQRRSFSSCKIGCRAGGEALHFCSSNEMISARATLLNTLGHK